MINFLFVEQNVLLSSKNESGYLNVILKFTRKKRSERKKVEFFVFKRKNADTFKIINKSGLFTALFGHYGIKMIINESVHNFKQKFIAWLCVNKIRVEFVKLHPKLRSSVCNTRLQEDIIGKLW